MAFFDIMVKKVDVIDEDKKNNGNDNRSSPFSGSRIFLVTKTLSGIFSQSILYGYLYSDQI